MAPEGEGPVYVAGHRGLVGSAILRALVQQGIEDVLVRTHAELDLTDQAAVERFFAHERPVRVYLAAAKVGGILANDTYPAEFIYQNLMIAANVIHAAWRSGVERLLFLGSSCIYPPQAPQPLSEESLLSGPLEPTNEPYAIAKIAGIKLCESYNRQYGTDFRSLMPTNLYGPGDNFDRHTSHVIPALIHRFHAAKVEGRDEVVVWGSGQARREFLHVDDLASACVFIMDLPPATYRAATQTRCSHLNVGSGEEIRIADLAELIREIVGFTGTIRFDPSRPEGPPRKRIDSRRLQRLGWQPRIDLREGLAQTYAWYLAHQARLQDGA